MRCVFHKFIVINEDFRHTDWGKVINYITSNGAWAIVDPHNYGR